MSNRKTSNNSSLLARDETIDSALRPIDFSEYIGQKRVKENLQMMIGAAKKRNESIDHLLLYGQAGLGKTTLAMIVAKEMGADIKITSGPVLEKTGDLAAILSTIEEGDVLFIDEAHRINRTIEEMLYPAMESRKLHLIIGKGPAARMMTLNLPQFTLIAATTRVNLLSSPLRSRFGGTFRLDYYTNPDIEKIVRRSASILGVDIEPAAVNIIASASRFTPRIANRLLKRVRDLIQISGKEIIDKESARKVLSMFEIDGLGLEEHDRKLLRTIIEKFGGGPVGISSLAATLGEDKGIIEDVYEPYLLKIGLLTRTSQGRVATEMAKSHVHQK
jgi:Holliday junction DNA helicase RuvB